MQKWGSMYHNAQIWVDRGSHVLEGGKMLQAKIKFRLKFFNHRHFAFKYTIIKSIIHKVSLENYLILYRKRNISGS